MLQSMPEATYRALPAVNASRLMALGTSPLWCRHVDTHGIAETDAMALGTACHAAILEPERFVSEYAVWDGGIRRGKAWDAWQEEHAGKRQITAGQAEQIQGIVAAVRAHPEAAEILAHGWPEQCAEFEVAGRAAKARIDWLTEGGSVVDIKICGVGIAPRRFFGLIADRGYHLQAAWYREGVRQCLGIDPDCYIIAAEPTPPFDVVLYRLTDAVLARGWELAEERLATLIECERTGIWPGCAPGIVDVALPGWA